MLSLTKGQTLELKKEDGTPISKVRVGLSWDAEDQNGHAVDADLFVHSKPAAGDAKTAYFNDKAAIKGVTLGEDNRTGAGDGDDERADFDATVSEDGVLFICVNIYDAVARGQIFGKVKNLSCRVYDQSTAANGNGPVIAEYKIAEDGGDNTALIVGKLTDKGNAYTFEAVGTFTKGDINEVVASL